MQDVSVAQPAPRTDTEYEAAIEELFVEMRQINARMDSNQAAVEHLRAKSEVLRMETRAVLTSLGAKI